MRPTAVLLLVLTACATGGPTGERGATRTSVAHLGAQRDVSSPVIRIQAGPVTVRHAVPSNARLRGTTLEGLDAANRHVTYAWERDGTYAVEVSGRYRHSVDGSIVGEGFQRLRSTLTYTPEPDAG